MARRKRTSPAAAQALTQADEQLLNRRARWLELRLVCQHADQEEPIREAALARARREAAKADDAGDRLAIFKAAYIEVFGEESLDRWLGHHELLASGWTTR